MAIITCPECKQSFDSSDTTNLLMPWAAGMAGGAAGALLGAKFGLATAGWGMPATLPVAAAGTLLAAFTAKALRRCPNCKRVFRV